MDRPNCALCGQEIPSRLLSDRDWQAASEGRKRPRPFYCSLSCMRVATDYNCGSPTCGDNWCGIKNYRAQGPRLSEQYARDTSAARQVQFSRRERQTETHAEGRTGVLVGGNA